MKRIVSISFLLLYLILSVGVAKSTHFCMGRAMDVSYFSYNGQECFGMPVDMENSCCSDELEVIKLKEDQRTSQVEVSGKKIYEIAPILRPLLISFLAPIDISEDLNPNIDPPPLVREPLYQLNCSFTFYG